MIPLNNSIPKEIQEIAYRKFSERPLRDKLVIYAKLAHGSLFKAQNNDLLDLSRRSISKIYRSFIEDVREELETKKSNNSKGQR